MPKLWDRAWLIVSFLSVLAGIATAEDAVDVVDASKMPPLPLQDYYLQPGQTKNPKLTIVDGDRQMGLPNVFLPNPLVVKVTDKSGVPLKGAPVTFSLYDTTGGFATKLGDRVAAYLLVTTDDKGLAKACFAGTQNDGVNSKIHVAAGLSMIAVTEYNAPIDHKATAASHITTVPGPHYGEVDVGWVNSDPKSSYVLILQSTDDTYWWIIKEVDGRDAHFYAVTGLDPSQGFYFGVVVGRPTKHPKPAKSNSHQWDIP